VGIKPNSLAALSALLVVLAAWASPCAAQSRWTDPASWVDVKWPSKGCDGSCAIYGFAGRNTSTSMTSIFGLDDVATFAPDKFVPIWNWTWEDASIVGAAMSRRLVTFFRVIDVEAELGVGQRFGRMNETEVWSALFFRWTWFPWNDYLRTTLATSTGLNWASGISDLERLRDGDRKGSQLLHYFSPEITFSLPQMPQWELVARLHHRSGAKVFFGDVAMFNGVDGGAHFGTLGVRYRF
jgi:hypothetical protein